MAGRKGNDLISRRQARNAVGHFSRSSVTSVPPSTCWLVVPRYSPIRLPSSTAGPSASRGTSTILGPPSTHRLSATLSASRGCRVEGRLSYSHSLPPMVVNEDVMPDDPVAPPSNEGFTPSPSRRKGKEAEADVANGRRIIVQFDAWNPRWMEPFADVGPQYKFGVEFDKLFCKMVITSESDEEEIAGPVLSAREVRHMAEQLRRAIRRNLKVGVYCFNDDYD